MRGVAIAPRRRGGPFSPVRVLTAQCRVQASFTSKSASVNLGGRRAWTQDVEASRSREMDAAVIPLTLCSSLPTWSCDPPRHRLKKEIWGLVVVESKEAVARKPRFVLLAIVWFL